jgi:hypothetical protein
MVIVIALALAIGLVGAWVYAGCPRPSRASALFFAGRVPDAERPAGEAVSSAPAPGASPARP